jgi:hypothetical protein
MRGPPYPPPPELPPPEGWDLILSRGSSLSSLLNRHAPIIFLRGGSSAFFGGGGGAASTVSGWGGGGTRGPGGACPHITAAHDKQTPLKKISLPNCFMVLPSSALELQL